jgi:peptide/nickel transport system substrate-binding protein
MKSNTPDDGPRSPGDSARLAAGAPLSRRELLWKGGAVGGALVLGAPLLSACDSGGESSTTATAGETPKRGGVLRLGISGGGSTDTLDPLAATTNMDYQRAAALFDYAYWPNDDFVIQPQLVQEATPNSDGSVWTIRLRDGIEFHNGKTLSADDLIFTIERIFTLDFSGLAGRFAVVNVKGMRKLDARTVSIPLKRPFSIFPNQLAQLPIVPVGFDPREPVGTGPFKFQSFKAGQESTFVRNPNWWGGFWKVKGTPYVDELRIIDFADDSARVNALLSNQVDAIDAVPFGQTKVVESQGFELFNVKTGNWRPFTMRVDAAPFDDVRVRQAMRLIPDRKQLIDQALSGFGTIGNDLYSPQDPVYTSADIPQREQDIEQARSLLRQAGHEGLEIELVTSPIQAGVVEASTVLASQAKAAGVNINIRRVDSGTFYGDNYLKWPFAVDWWTPLPYLDQAVTADGPNAAFNETHFNDPEFNRLYGEALRQTDESKRVELQHEMMRIQHERGGYIIWGFANTIDAHSKQVRGMEPTKYGQDFSDSRFWKLWLA